MKATEQTLGQLERVLRKIVQKFPASEEASQMTDIHLRVTQESGEMRAYDDEENEITRCVVEQWIDNKDTDFYESVTRILRRSIEKLKPEVDELGIMKPYSFVLEDEERESVAELYVADDDTVIIGGELMEDLDKDLNAFFDELFKEQ